MGDYKPHTAEMKNGGGALKAPTKRTYFSKACSLLVTLTLAVGLCPSVALASPEDTMSDKPVVKQPVDPSTALTEQAPEPLAEETPAPGTSSDNLNPSDTPESQRLTVPNAPAQPAPDAEASEPEQAVEPEATPEASEEPTASALASSEYKTTTIDGVTYKYYVVDKSDEANRYGAGAYIYNTSWAPLITIPAQIEGIDVVYFATETAKEGNGSFHLDASKASSLVYLFASWGVLSLNISNNAALREINVFSGSLTELDVSKCKKLESLDCPYNRLTSLDVTKNPVLQKLYVGGNHLTQLNLRNNPQLTDLTCYNNDLVELDVSANAQLGNLQCSNNMLTTLDISANTQLVSLECGSNMLAKLDISANAQLRQFSCCNNRISDTKALTDRFDVNRVLPQYPYALSSRLEGDTALDTMASITDRWMGNSHTVIVATMGGYWDALTASSLAGLNHCPILLTDGTMLSSQTATCIKKIGASRVFIAGGPAAISAKVESSLKNVSGVKTVKRLEGATAIETALKIHEEGKGSWGTTAVVATSETFQDALSVSPYAYAKNAPIFLANASTHKLDSNTLSVIKAGGFKQIVIVGGLAALSDQIEKQQLKDISCTRLAGATAYETSTAIAKWCLAQGMTAVNAGIATGSSYYDALAGAAFCGKNNSVLVLVSDDNRSSIKSFIAPNKNSIKELYVFGGPAAVSSKTYDLITAALK